MSGVRGYMSVDSMLTIIRRVPFTLMMLLGIGSVGLATGTNEGALAPAIAQRWGFALHDLWQGTWYSLVTEVWFTRHPFMFWGILGFVVFSIGVYEWRAGTKRAFLLYWLTDVSGALILTLGFVLPLYLLNTDLGLTLAFADDVGMSGGGFGCVGGWVHWLDASRRWWAFTAVMVYLVLHLILVFDLASDLLHIVTFCLGFWQAAFKNM